MTNELTAQQNGLVTNQAQLQIFTQTTPKEAIRTRQGRGGRVLLYTDGAYVIRTLNEAFGHNWDLEADNEEIFWFNEKPFEAKCRVKLTVRIGDTSITKMQYGCQPIEMLSNGTAPVSIGDALKGAATDGLKKCASLLGIALDLYDSDSQINTANPQQVQKEIAQAKAQATKAPVTIEQHTTTHMPNGQVIVANKTIDAATGEVVKPKGKIGRPMSSEQVKQATTAKREYTVTKKPSDNQATYAYTSLSKACEGDDDTRHIVIEYLFGLTSMKDMTGGQCSFIIDWCGAKAENEYTVNSDTMKEIRGIVREVVKMAGQTDMFEADPERNAEWWAEQEAEAV